MIAVTPGFPDPNDAELWTLLKTCPHCAAQLHIDVNDLRPHAFKMSAVICTCVRCKTNINFTNVEVPPVIVEFVEKRQLERIAKAREAEKG